ncbi:MAG: dephospho-CoA kinase [Actinomycetota bacterium]|nr:dephospho-CoA kinase [Actinomycetota bacterium]
MLVVGLTGGIGSGKSTVSAMLADRGAVVIDTDVIAREVVAPGTPGYTAVVDRFGPSVVRPGGELDRSALARHVFSDEQALADLNAIVHPAVRASVGERLARLQETDHLVVLVVPLLVEVGVGAYDVSGVLVVDCAEEVAVARLVGARGMDEADARRRLATQASRSERLAAADFVVENDGSLEQLEAEVGRAWEWMRGLRDGPPRAQSCS